LIKLLDIVQTDITTAAGSLQVCAGLDGSCEAAVHAIRSFPDNFKTEAVLLADTTNASIGIVNHQAALQNIPSFVSYYLSLRNLNDYSIWRRDTFL